MCLFTTAISTVSHICFLLEDPSVETICVYIYIHTHTSIYLMHPTYHSLTQIINN